MKSKSSKWWLQYVLLRHRLVLLMIIVPFSKSSSLLFTHSWNRYTTTRLLTHWRHIKDLQTENEIRLWRTVGLPICSQPKSCSIRECDLSLHIQFLRSIWSAFVCPATQLSYNLAVLVDARNMNIVEVAPALLAAITTCVQHYKWDMLAYFVFVHISRGRCVFVTMDSFATTMENVSLRKIVTKFLTEEFPLHHRINFLFALFAGPCKCNEQRPCCGNVCGQTCDTVDSVCTMDCEKPQPGQCSCKSGYVRCTDVSFECVPVAICYALKAAANQTSS